MTKRVLLILLMLLPMLTIMIRAQEERPLYALPGSNEPVYASGSMALTNTGLLVTANMLNGTMSIVSPREAARIAEIEVGADPRSVALTPDNTKALIVNRLDGTLSVVDMTAFEVIDVHPVGTLPYAVVAGNDQTAYVSLQGTSEVIELDITSGEILNRFAVPDFPAGLSLWGDFLYVTHFWSGQLTLVYLPQKMAVRTVSTGRDTGLFQSLTIDPTDGIAYLPQTRSNAQATALTYDTIVFPVINIIDLFNLGLRRQDRIALDVADRPVNMPFAAVLGVSRSRLFVANAGSDDVSVIDLTTGLSLAHINVDSNPRDLLLSRDGSLLYVHNTIDGTVTVIQTSDYRIQDTVLVSDLRTSIDVLIGAQLFHSAVNPQLALERRVSCASCHFDGQSDGLVWSGFSNGPRNTPVLYGLQDTAPYTWSGTWDEIADVELKIRALQSGSGLIDGAVNAPLGNPHAGESIDLDTLAEYLLTLPGVSAPVVADEEQVNRGAEVFVELNCAVCHTDVGLTDGQQYDVGTGGLFDTPTLNWLWQSAPYFHDGRAETLEELFVLPGDHQLISTVSQADIAALIDYLISLPQ